MNTNRLDLLKEIIDSDFGGKQASFARAIKRPPALVHQWLKGYSKFGDASARNVELRLGLPPGYFNQTKITKRNSVKVAPAKSIEPGPDIKGKVPLISYVQAGNWSETIEFMPDDAISWLPCPVCHSNKTFALRVRGESMYNPHKKPSFEEGDLIFVDPERQPINGSLVVARLENENEATFKKLIIDGDKKYLSALNPAWPEPIIHINSKAKICGVVIFKGEII